MRRKKGNLMEPVLSAESAGVRTAAWAAPTLRSTGS